MGLGKDNKNMGRVNKGSNGAERMELSSIIVSTKGKRKSVPAIISTVRHL